MNSKDIVERYQEEYLRLEETKRQRERIQKEWYDMKRSLSRMTRPQEEVMEQKSRFSRDVERMLQIEKNKKFLERLPNSIKSSKNDGSLPYRASAHSFDVGGGHVIVEVTDFWSHVLDRLDEISRAVRGNNTGASEHDGSKDVETLSRE